ncbi:MAG: GerAB/ArcD/ProY family transporter [Symbiobacteriia bacterium]
METGRISSWQFFQLIVTIMFGLTLARIPSSLVGLAGPDAWLAMLIGVGIDLAVGGALYVLGRRFPGRTLFEYPPLILGRVPGKVVAALFIWLFVHAAAASIFVFAAGFQLVLPETPLLAFIILMVSVSTVGAYYGLETLARASELTSFLAAGVSILILTLSAKDMDLANLKPMLANGLRGPVQAGLVAASWFGICIVMGLFMAYHNRPKNAFLAKASGVAVGATIVLTLVLGSIAALGPAQAGIQREPIWSLTRIIAVAAFFERLQMLFVGMLMTTGLVTLGLLQHASSLGIAQLFGLKEYRPLVLPMGLVLAALAQGLFSSHLEVEPFFEEAFPPYALLVEGGLTFLLLVVAWLRGSRAADPHSRQQVEEGASDGGKYGV